VLFTSLSSQLRHHQLPGSQPGRRYMHTPQTDIKQGNVAVRIVVCVLLLWTISAAVAVATSAAIAAATILVLSAVGVL